MGPVRRRHDAVVDVIDSGRLQADLRLFLQALREDVSWGLRDVVVNEIAGFVLMPRFARWVIYRASGLDVRAPNIYPGCTFTGGRAVTIGPKTFINRECYFESVAPIAIGRECAFGMQVLVVTSTHVWGDAGHFSVEPEGRPVTIGDRCWIGARAIVLPGVTIGDDVVVAAGSVVTRDCAPNGLYAGSPARRIRDIPPRQGRSQPAP